MRCSTGSPPRQSHDAYAPLRISRHTCAARESEACEIGRLEGFMSGVANSTVLVFDSGLGGLTVLRELARTRPDLKLVYAADDAAFPYGRLDKQALVGR